MDPFTMMLIAGGLGAATNLIGANEQKKQAAQQNAINAEMTRYSPWTGMRGEMVQGPNVTNEMLKGALSGAMFAQQFGKGTKDKAPEPSPFAMNANAGMYDRKFTELPYDSYLLDDVANPPQRSYLIGSR